MTACVYGFDESPGTPGAGNTSRPVRFIKTIFAMPFFKNNFFLIVLPLVIAGGCSTRLPPAGVAAYQRCDYDKAIDIFTKADKKEKDLLLYDLAILSSAVHGKKIEEAEKVGTRAQQQMWSYEGKTQGELSLLSSEALRIYKGEPFEKSMASMYLGILYFNDGDYENAKAAFTKAMFAVQTKGEDSTADFAAPLVLLAKTYLKLNDEENARVVLGRLEKFTNNKNLTLQALKKIKTIAFIELGSGPKKIRTGPGDSLVGWERQLYSDRTALLKIDDAEMEKFRIGDDLTYQAQSVDRGSKTAIQGTKGALREAATITTVIAANEAVNRRNKTAGWVALGAGLFALANQSQADIRQWEFLPDRVELILAPEPTTEGRHQFEVHFQNAYQNDLPSLNQVWYDERKLDQDKIYIIQANRCGGYKKGE